MKKTKIGNSYWDKNAAYSEEYEKLYDELVPSVGKAETIEGELIRIGSRIAHDYFNNGNINVLNTEDDQIKIDNYYQDMIDFLKRNITNQEVIFDLEKFVLDKNKGYGNYTFDDSEIEVYNNLLDTIVYEVIQRLKDPKIKAKNYAMQNDNDTGAIALFALRYCMGRMTYAPSMTIDWIKKYWETFRKGDHQNIKRDVKEFLDSDLSKGMDCDEQTWNSFYNWLENKC